MTQFIYTGASTASKAFYTEEGNDDLSQLVNLGKLFSVYSGYEMISETDYGKPNKFLMDKIIESGHSKDIPIFWVYADPIMGLFFDGAGRTFPELPKANLSIAYKLITEKGWLDTLYEIADAELAYLNSTGYRIGFVGSSGDINPLQVEKYENLTVIDESWKGLLARESGIKFDQLYFNSTVLHQIVNIFFPLDNQDWTTLWKNDPTELKGLKNINPDIVDLIYNIYKLRNDLEDAECFLGVHPNIKGNMLYHEHIKERVKKFIDGEL